MVIWFLMELTDTDIQRVSLINLLTGKFKELKGKPAIIFYREGEAETGLTYGDLDIDSDALARRLLASGVEKGDRVLLFLPKCLFGVIAHLAILKIGAVCVPLNPALKSSELEFLIRQSGPKLAVAGLEQEKTVGEIDPGLKIITVDGDQPYAGPPADDASTIDVSDIALQDPGTIIFTSGTTGLPKGVILTQGNLGHDAQNVKWIWEINEKDVFCHALPLFHVHGLCFGLHTALLAGATIRMTDAFRPDDVLNLLSQKDCTLFMAVPTMYHRLLEAGQGKSYDFSHLRLITSGSAPLLEKDFDRIRDFFGLEPVEREGMSETLMNFSNPLHGRRKPGSIGLPLPHVQVKIVDPVSFKEKREGEVGELWLRSPAITPGYWQRPEETARTFADGWFRTGDLGRRDEEGYYYLTDRIKNIIISGGENISPREVEMVINELEGVLESCVTGIPDDEWGEAVVAAVALKGGARLSVHDIDRRCREKLMNWKCPKKILVLDELPKNRMGKVLRDKIGGLFD